MLKSIYINNFAIIDELELDFFSGMSVLTGETGAGKSIIIDALNLALGNRADRLMARDVHNKVEVVATLDINGIKPAITWLKQRDLYIGDDCILHRIVSTDGKSKVYINNTPCSVMALRSVGNLFVDVYGQHEHQSLIHKDKQRELLDGFAGNETRIEKLVTCYHLWQDLTDQLQAIEHDRETTRSRLDLLCYQCHELEQLDLSHGEYEELNAEYTRASNAKALNESSWRISQKLAGEGDNRICDQLYHAISELEKCSAIDEKLKELSDTLQSTHIQLKEISNTLRDYAEKISADPRELKILEERIAAIEEVARKHKVKPPQLIELRTSLQAELEKFENNHTDPDKIRKSMQETEHHYRALAKEISLARKQAALELNQKITDSMQFLGMQGGRFYIDVQAKKSTKPSPDGLDKIYFMVNTNPGQSLRILNKVASGGELSRLSLAIQITTANNLRIPTLIFDEVDTGVGGATAEVVGRHLRKLSDNAQVFCVTHLPQVAAQAHHHYKVTKFERGKSIVVEISNLAETARIEELARMLGGIEMTRNAHEYAKEMLCQIKNQQM